MALNGGVWLMPRPRLFTPGKGSVPILWEMGGPQGRSGRVRKSRPHRDYPQIHRHLIVKLALRMP